MEHVVFYPVPDGAPAFRRLDNLEEAVRLVEHLRNVEGVGEASVHSLTEVPLSFRAYYRVEVPGLSSDVPEVTPGTETVHVDAPVEQPQVEESQVEQVTVQLAPESSPEPAVPQGVDVAALEPEPVPEEAVDEQRETYELVAVGAPAEQPEPEQVPAAHTGGPFGTDRTLGFFA